MMSAEKLAWNRGFAELRVGQEVELACLVHGPQPMQVRVLARWHVWAIEGQDEATAPQWWQLTLNEEPLPSSWTPYAWADPGELPPYEVTV